jgi:hypothetical protein
MDKKKKFQSGAASVLDDPDILNVIPTIRKPNLMGDPSKLGIADLGPLLAMMAAGAYPAVSAMTDKEGKLRDRGIIVPPQGLTDEEKKQLGLDGSPAGGGFTPIADKDKLPTTTAGELPEVIPSSPPPFPLPEPPTFEDMVPGGGIRPAEGVPDMSIMTMADQSKKEDTSKALVPTKMMESLADLPDPKETYQSEIAPRFSQTEDYLKSNYTGSEKKLINDWVNELFNPQKGLTLELRDTGIAAQLEQINQANPKRKVTSKELLELVQAADNQLAGFGNYQIMGGDQELFPQTVQNAIQGINEMDVVMRPGQLSDFVDRYKNLVTDNLKSIQNVTDRDTAADALAKIQVQTQELLAEEDIDKSILERNREYASIQDYIRQVGSTLQGTVFTNEHMSIGLPGTRAEDYSVITHNFNPKFNQDTRTSEHNTSHPTADNTVAFSRGRKIQNYENGDQGSIIMEMQSDVHRNKTAIEYPTSANDFTSSKNFYPYAGGAQYWVKQVMKDRLTQALIDGDDFLGWVPGEVVSHYEGADKDNYKGFINIYNNKTNEFIKKLNKDITKRGKALGMSEEEINKATLKVKNDGQYKFESGGDEYFARVKENQYPGMEKYVRTGEKKRNKDPFRYSNIENTLQLINMPYIDLKPRADFDPELLKKIGFPQFKKGGKTKTSKADPLIDIEIFFESV